MKASFAALLAVVATMMGYRTTAGELSPTNGPAPTMKTLQELWDRLQALETKVSGVQTQVQQSGAASEALTLDLAHAQGLSVAHRWNISFAGHGGSMGTGTSLAFTPEGRPAITYFQYGGYGSEGDYLFYAVRDGASWPSQRVVHVEGDMNWRTSLKFTPAGEPAVSYCTGASIQYAEHVSTGWVVRTVAPAGGSGQYVPLAFTPQGHPAVSFYDSSAGDLKYAEYDGTAWIVETVDSAGDVGRHSSLCFTPSGHPAISYVQEDPVYDLKYAEHDGTAWVIQTADNQGLNVGYASSLRFTPAGRPAIAYMAEGGGPRYVEHNGMGWVTQKVANVVYGYWETLDLAFTPAGRPAIVFMDGNAWVPKYTEQHGTNWTIEVVDPGDHIGKFPSLAFTPAGQPAIAYWDAAQTHPKYAESTGVMVLP